MTDRYRRTYSTWIKIAAIVFVGASIVAYFRIKAERELARAKAESISTGAYMESADAEKELSKVDVEFLSWDGVWQGTDCDQSMTFSPNGMVAITYYGYDVESVVGTYKANGSTITISAKWDEIESVQLAADELPQFTLRRDKGALYLFPASAIWVAKYCDDFGWPLRQPRERIPIGKN